MNFQIDVKPSDPGYTSHSINLYIDGYCYNLLASKDTVEQFKNAGLVAQTKGLRHNEQNELVEFEYENGVDGTGVKYTSKLFKLTEVKY